MFLHALLMGVAGAPRLSGENALAVSLQNICTGMTVDSGAMPSIPGTAKAHSAPCALCGIGHAVLDVPAAIRVALPRNIIETLAQAPASEPLRPRLDLSHKARPRAPPALV